MPQQFVTAFNGPRDYYELPLALHEMGMLHVHVGDLYCPDALARAPFVPRGIRGRHREGLASSRVHTSWYVALRQRVMKDRGPDPHLSVDRALSLEAARIAMRDGCDLFVHSQYAYWAFKALPDRRRFMYQFHPHPAAVRGLLAADLALHPQVRWSFENELDSLPLERQRQESLEECVMADGILCASAFTKRSLVAQGCKEERVRVVPYGIFPRAANGAAPGGTDGICRFLFVGQGVQRKGLHHLLKAWRLASLKGATLTVVARKLDPGIRPLLDAAGVTHVAGADSGELESLYESASVFVMPSLVEGFGLVYLEALAAGLHCIGTANTGLPDLELPDDCVTLVPVGDIPALAASLERCRDDFAHGRLDRAAVRARAAALTWDRRRLEMRRAIAAMLQS